MLIIQCDERHPQCGQCMKKNRPCQYEYGKVPKFVSGQPKLADGAFRMPADDSSDFSEDSSTAEQSWNENARPNAFDGKGTILALRSVKGAEDGNGIFHTFSSVRLDKQTNLDLEVLESSWFDRRTVAGRNGRMRVLRTLTSPVDSLRARFIEVMGPKPMQWNSSFLWGTWIALVPARLGKNSALDAATACFIAGSIAHRSKSEANIAAARKQYSKALLSLQNVLTGMDQDLRLSSETLAAVKFLLVFEVSYSKP